MALNDKVKAMLVLMCLVMATTVSVAEAAGGEDNKDFGKCMQKCVWDCKSYGKMPPSECPQFCANDCRPPHS